MDDDKIAITGSYAGLIALAEIGIGSLFHAFHFPFTGYCLSLNQILVLTKATQQNANAFSISSIASILKSLSPMGKKLTPMLAIAMQGLLYQIGIIVFGYNIVGNFFGACLSSTWGFIQPILLYYFVFGSIFFEAIFHYLPKDYVYLFFGLCVLLKCILAIGIVLAAPYISATWWTRWIPIKKPKTESSTDDHIAVKSAKDLFRLPFLFSLLLTSTYWFALEGDYTKLIIYIARTIAVAFCIFFLLRVFPVQSLADWFSKKQWKSTQALAHALKFISEQSI